MCGTSFPPVFPICLNPNLQVEVYVKSLAVASIERRASSLRVLFTKIIVIVGRYTIVEPHPRSHLTRSRRSPTY